MLNSKLKRISLALVLAVILTLSLSSLSAFALEDAGAAPDGEQGIVLDVAAPAESDTATTEAEDTTAAEAEDADAAAKDTEAATEAEGDTVTTTGEADDHEGHDHDHETTEEKKGFTTGSIISLAALGVVIILVVVYCLTHKEKVAKLFRGLKSEMKKIVWTPWNQVRKNTLVVLVVIISAAILIGLLDFLFSKGIFTLGKLF